MLQAIITQLAGRHATPHFHPHLTLAGDIPQAPDVLSSALKTIAAAGRACVAPITKIGMTGEFFRSFYAAFPILHELQAMRSAAEKTLARDFGPFMPHISLLYGPVDEKAKQASADTLCKGLVNRPIRFDRLALTNSANVVPVADWRILSIAHLTTENAG